jgi:hypothetical protein
MLGVFRSDHGFEMKRLRSAKCFDVDVVEGISNRYIQDAACRRSAYAFWQRRDIQTIEARKCYLSPMAQVTSEVRRSQAVIFHSYGSHRRVQSAFCIKVRERNISSIGDFEHF